MLDDLFSIIIGGGEAEPFLIGCMASLSVVQVDTPRLHFHIQLKLSVFKLFLQLVGLHIGGVCHGPVSCQALWATIIPQEQTWVLYVFDKK